MRNHSGLHPPSPLRNPKYPVPCPALCLCPHAGPWSRAHSIGTMCGPSLSLMVSLLPHSQGQCPSSTWSWRRRQQGSPAQRGGKKAILDPDHNPSSHLHSSGLSSLSVTPGHRVQGGKARFFFEGLDLWSFPAPTQCPNSGPKPASMGLPCLPVPLTHPAETQSDIRDHAIPLPPAVPNSLSCWSSLARMLLEPAAINISNHVRSPHGQVGSPGPHGAALAEVPPSSFS